jgi:hypothetical protein
VSDDVSGAVDLFPARPGAAGIGCLKAPATISGLTDIGQRPGR